MRSICSFFVVLGLAGAGLAQPAATGSKPAAPSAPRKVDKAAAYYHYTLGHVYEEQVVVYGRSELANKAIEEYRLAIEADPTSQYLTSALAELYFRTSRIRDAVVEAQDILKRDPNNLEAHRLLGRIYLKSLGDIQGGNGSQNVLKLAIEQYEQIVKLQPDSVDDHLLLGRLYKVNNDLQKAENEFKTAVKLQPDSEEAVTMLAYLYNDEGDTARAAQVLSSIPDAARSARLYSALGYTYEQQKQYKNAIQAYKRAIELDRDNLDAIRGLAQNLFNDGQTDAALEQYKIIADANPEDAQTYIQMAEIYRKTGKFDQALENLKKAEPLVPDAIQVPYNIAAVYQAQGRYDEAIEILQNLLKKTEKADNNYRDEERNNREAFFDRLAVIYQVQGRFDDAAQLLQGLLKKTEKPDNNYNQNERNSRTAFLERLGAIYRDSNNMAQALETFRKMLTLGDESAERGYQGIIDTYREAKQWPQATDAAKEAAQKLPNNRQLQMVYAAQLADTGQAAAGLQKVKSLLQGKPEDREVYITLWQMYSRLKRWPEAEDALNRAEQLAARPEEKEYINYLRGSGYERQKKYDQAEETFRKILSASPQNAGVLNYLGYMLADRGVKLEEALGFVKKAVELEPANGAYLDSLGWAYFKLGKYELAEDNLIRASQRIATDPTVQDHLGDLYQKTGRLKLAAAHWERALQEWNKTVATEVDPADVAKVQKKLESAKVKLAKEDPANK